MNIAISLHIFNRPKETKIVFEKIRTIQPEKLFITADGARPNRPDDTALCEEVRKIATDVDWKCALKTRFHTENLGSHHAIADGISWVFTHVDSAIILEDDCIPHISFFAFCEHMLEQYQDNKQIALVSGSNFAPQLTADIPDDYFLSNYTHTWGWATWKDRWTSVDLSSQSYESPHFKQLLRKRFSVLSEFLWWESLLQRMVTGKEKEHWDYIFLLNSVLQERYCLVPKVNLIKNIGYGDNATHTQSKSAQQDVGYGEMHFPPHIQNETLHCAPYDAFLGQTVYGRRGIGYIKNKFKDILFLLNKTFHL